MTLQFAEMIVRKNANAGPAQACAIDERSVSQFINHDDIVFPGDGRKSADCRCEPLLKAIAAGAFFHFAIARSSATCGDCVPETRRDAPAPTPNCSIACVAAARSRSSAARPR